MSERPYIRRAICWAALWLLATSLALVVVDRALFSSIEHRPDTCPICGWALGLSSSALAAPVLPVEHIVCSWHMCETPVMCQSEPYHGLVSVRAPPAEASQ